MSDTTKRPVSTVKAFAYSVSIVVVLLFLLEGAARVWANYLRLDYLTYSSRYDRPVLVPNAQIQTGIEHISINSKGFVGPEFTQQKSPNSFRVIALGDSCTFAGGWYETTYSGMLQSLLNSGSGGRRVEVINAGIPGYNSEFALARLRDELLTYQPDLVSIYIGWNDLMKTNPSNPAATDQHRRLWKAINESYLVKAYAKLIFFYLRPLLMKPRVDENLKEHDAFANFVPAVYQANLETMMRTLKTQRIQIVLVTLPTVVRAHMTEEEIEKAHVFFPYFAGAYSLERFLSLHRAYNTVIKQVAAFYQVPLVDLDAIFDEYPKDDLFYDTMHLSLKGNKVVADSMAPVMFPLISKTVDQL